MKQGGFVLLQQNFNIATERLPSAPPVQRKKSPPKRCAQPPGKKLVMIDELRAALAQSSENLCAALSVTSSEYDVSPSQEEIAAVEEQCQQVAEVLLQLSQQPPIVIPSQEIKKHLGATQESVIKELSITAELLLKASEKLYKEGDTIEVEHLLQAVERRSPSVSPVHSAPATPARRSPPST